VSDLRRATRHFVSIATKLTINGTTVDAVMTNLSLGGASVSSEVKHSMGQRVHISFKVPGQEHLIEISSTVRWTDSKGLGLQFDGLRAQDVWALNKFFKSLQ
jgi:hypothetical protein